MRYPTALFVTPHAEGRFFGGVRPPVGIAYVEEYVAAHGVRTAALDMTLGGTFSDLLRTVDEVRPDVVGVTVMTYQHRHTYDLIARLKRLRPGVAVVIGGAHVCATGAEALRQCAAVDYAIAGEGERPMRDLCLGAALEGIAGLHHRAGDRVIEGSPPELVEDLDSLPFPRFNSYPTERYANEIEISTSRGCPYACIFCAVPSIMGRRIRRRSPRSVGEELAYFHARGVRSIQFGDDNFLADRRHVLEILEQIDRRALHGLLFRCGQGIRADLLDDALLLALKRAGFRHLGIGVESGSDRVLQVIGKQTDTATIDERVAAACHLGFDVSLLFVVGTPTETPADVEASIRLAQRHPVMKAFFFNLVPFPGTPLFRWVCEHDAWLAPYDELINRADELKLRSRPFFQTPELPAAERVRALARCEAVSKDIQVRALRRKLSGLGPLAPLAALAGRSDLLERLFVRNRRLRSLLDRIVFRAGALDRQRGST